MDIFIAQVLFKIGATQPLTDLLTKLDIKFTLFDGCEPNPTVDQVRLTGHVLNRNANGWRAAPV